MPYRFPDHWPDLAYLRPDGAVVWRLTRIQNLFRSCVFFEEAQRNCKNRGTSDGERGRGELPSDKKISMVLSLQSCLSRPLKLFVFHKSSSSLFSPSILNQAILPFLDSVWATARSQRHYVLGLSILIYIYICLCICLFIHPSVHLSHSIECINLALLPGDVWWHHRSRINERTRHKYQYII